MTRAALSAVLACGLVSVAAPRAAAGPAAVAPTFTRDVAPILYNSCISCHRAGEVAPMSLMSYEEVRPWAKSMRLKVANREMPPWGADSRFGKFKDDRSLTPEQIDTIARWVDAGAPRGSEADLPPAPTFASGWSHGEPDVVIEMPVDFEIPAQGQVPVIDFFAKSPFTQDVYVKVAEAYIAGLEQFAKNGGDVSRMASVASFFISRIDSAVDAIIETRLKASKDAREQEQLKSIQGKVAIANGKQTYEKYQTIFSTPRWKALAAKGAQTQRVLWASTSTKNPAYRDVLYVEELIGPDTVDTIPPATLDAFRDHGKTRQSLTEDLPSAHKTMETAAKLGISMKEVTDKLTDDGVRLFSEAFDKLLAAVEKSSKSK